MNFVPISDFEKAIKILDNSIPKSNNPFVKEDYVSVCVAWETVKAKIVELCDEYKIVTGLNYEREEKRIIQEE